MKKRTGKHYILTSYDGATWVGKSERNASRTRCSVGANAVHCDEQLVMQSRAQGRVDVYWLFHEAFFLCIHSIFTIENKVIIVIGYNK